MTRIKPPLPARNAGRRTSRSLVVTGTTDRLQRKPVNIRSVLKQKIRYQKGAVSRAEKELARMQEALRALSKNKER